MYAQSGYSPRQMLGRLMIEADLGDYEILPIEDTGSPA